MEDTLVPDETFEPLKKHRSPITTFGQIILGLRTTFILFETHRSPIKIFEDTLVPDETFEETPVFDKYLYSFEDTPVLIKTFGQIIFGLRTTFILFETHRSPIKNFFTFEDTPVRDENLCSNYIRLEDNLYTFQDTSVLDEKPNVI